MKTLVSKTYKLIFLFAFFATPGSIHAQETAFHQFRKLSRPEKIWVIRHPFIAKKAFRITQIALAGTNSVSSHYNIDSDIKGGQLDAFKHGYWMALLSRKIAPGKALKLGNAHEKGNYLQYKKGNSGNGETPDRASCIMDTWNNDAGIRIGLHHKGSDEAEIKKLVVEAILNGEMKIMKKDSLGNYLDCDGHPISPDLLKKWDNPKCLVASDKRE